MNKTVQFLTDEAGQKTAVVLPVADYERLMEELEDLTAIADRRKEPTVAHDQFLEELRRDGILSD